MLVAPEHESSRPQHSGRQRVVGFRLWRRVSTWDATQEAVGRRTTACTVYITKELRTLIEAQFSGRPRARTGNLRTFDGRGTGAPRARACAIPLSTSPFRRLHRSRRRARCRGARKRSPAIWGTDKSQWSAYDATEIILGLKGCREPSAPAHRPRAWPTSSWRSSCRSTCFEAAAKKKSVTPLTLRRQEGYDHGYYFISTFMEDHLRHHAKAACKVGLEAAGLRGGDQDFPPARRWPGSGSLRLCQMTTSCVSGVSNGH